MALALLAPVNASARRVSAMFRQGELSFPAGSTRCSIFEAVFGNEDLRDRLLAFGVDSVFRTFPRAVPSDTFYSAGASLGFRLVDRMRFVELHVPDSNLVQCLCDSLRGRPDVVFAQPAGFGESCGQFFPDDPFFSQQWAHHNTGQSGGVPDVDVDAPEAWWTLLGAGSPPVGVLEHLGGIYQGVWAAHPDLSSSVSGDISPPFYPHSNEVVGVIAARTNNGIGIAGMNGAATIYFRGVQAPEDLGNTEQVQLYDGLLADAIDDIVVHGARLINCSFRLVSAEFPFDGPRRSLILDAAISDAYKRNALVVAAMGNGALLRPLDYPAASGQGVLAVGSIGRTGSRSNFSEIGAHIDVVAPGEQVLTTTTQEYGTYRTVSGTSLAAPLATGVGSLLLGLNGNLLNDDVEQLIRLSADDIAPIGWDQETGMGRLNAARALEYLQPPWVIVGNSVAGGTAVDSTAIYPAVILGVAGLPEGRYDVRRIEVRAILHWGALLPTIVGAWGRGALTRGFAPGDTLFGAGWCEPVPGTVGMGDAMFRTYVYRVWDPQSSADLGYFPAPPSGVLMAGAVLGQYAAGCPQLEAAWVGRWRTVRTVLQRLPSDSSAIDRIELPGWAVLNRELELRLVENAAERTRLRYARLLRVASAADEEVASGTIGLRAGRFVAPLGIRSSVGGELRDILTGQLSYSLTPGETLWVEKPAPGTMGLMDHDEGENDPIIIDDGGKDGGGPSPSPASALAGLGARDVDILTRTGVELWAEDRLSAVRYPQSERSAELFAVPAAKRVRLVSRGYHRLWRVGWFRLSPPLAVDTLGVELFRPDGRAVSLAAGTYELASGDTLVMRSVGLNWAPIESPAGRIRYLLELDGGYRALEGAVVQGTPNEDGESASTPWARIQPGPSAGPVLVFTVPHPVNAIVEQFDLQGRRIGPITRLNDLSGGTHLVDLDGLSGTVRPHDSMRFVRLTAGQAQVVLKAPAWR